MIIDAKSAELVSLSIDLNSIIINQLVINVNRDKDGALSLNKLIPQSNDTVSDKPEDKKESSPLKLKIDRFSLKQAKLHFTDYTFYRPFTHKVDTININLKDINLAKGCEYIIDLVNRGTEKIGLDGQFTFKPLEMKGKCNLLGLEPKSYEVYFPSNLNLGIKDGFVDIESNYHIITINDTNEILLSNGSVKIRDLSVWQRSVKEEVFRNKEFAIWL